MKTCPSCGKEIPDEASFCVYCMTQLTPVTEVSTPQTSSKGNSTITKLLAALCILLTVAVIILAIRTGNNTDNISNADNSSQTTSQTEQYSALCQGLIDRMAQSGTALDETAKSSEILGCDFGDSYDAFDIAQYGIGNNMDDAISLRTRLNFSAGDVFIEYARKTDYIKCTVLGVPQDNSKYQSPSLDAFKLMQVLYSTRTGSTETKLYEFLCDNETYPLTEKNANWSDTDEYIQIWYDSVVNDGTTVSITRKDGSFDNINVTLLVRTRQYGDIAFYDYQFMMY